MSYYEPSSLYALQEEKNYLDSLGDGDSGVETDLMCVLCSEFSCRVGNNHQIQRREKKEEDELLAQQTFPFFYFF